MWKSVGFRISRSWWFLGKWLPISGILFISEGWLPPPPSGLMWGSNEVAYIQPLVQKTGTQSELLLKLFSSKWSFLTHTQVLGGRVSKETESFSHRMVLGFCAWERLSLSLSAPQTPRFTHRGKAHSKHLVVKYRTQWVWQGIKVSI